MEATKIMTHTLEDAPTNPAPAKRAKKEEKEEQAQAQEAQEAQEEQAKQAKEEAKEAKEEAKEEAKDGKKIQDLVEAITKHLLTLREHVLASTLRPEHLSAMPDFTTVALKLPKRVKGAKPGPLLGNDIHQYFRGLNTDAGALQFLDDVNNQRLFRHSGHKWKDDVNGPLNECPEAVNAMLNGQPALALYLLTTAFGCATSSSDVSIMYCDVAKAIIGCMLRPELGLPQRALAMAQLVLLERACMLTAKQLIYSKIWSLYQTDQEVARDICVALLAFLTDGDFRPTGYLIETETSVHAYHMLCMRPVARRARDAELFNHSISSDLLIKKEPAATAAKSEDEDDGFRPEYLHVEGVCPDCTKCVSFLDYNVEHMNKQILKAKRIYAPALDG